MSERTHARLSASGAKRWLACPRSVALEENEEEKESPFALEGTKAHEVAELILSHRLGYLPQRDYFTGLARSGATQDMIDYVELYVAGCIDSYLTEKLKNPHAIALVETRVEFTNWVPDGFGTCDFMVISGNRLIIRDMKYGKGVPVSAEDNPQIRLYALGALQDFGYIYDIEEVEMHIDQPRLNAYTSEVMTAEALLEWGESIKGKAEDAHDDKGDFNPGEHCKFCRVRATCRARASHMLDVVNTIVKK